MYQKQTRMDEYTDEYIRPPDEPIRECLLPPSGPINTVLFEQQELRRVLEESEIDYELQFALAESKRMEEEREERCRHFADFRIKITQFEKMDKTNADFYKELIHYIDMYERYGSSPFVVTEHFYVKFRKMADNMRLKPDEKTRLLELIKM